MKTLISPKSHGLFARNELSARQRDEMFSLLSSHFEGVTRSQFERDLGEKNWVIEVRKADRLIGFTTLLVQEANFEGKALIAIYSGDTIVAPEGWGTPALARNWIASVNYLRSQLPCRPCYWLLLTSGFRTYRFLPVFWREFFPRFDSVASPDQRRLRDHLAHAHYPDYFNQQAGVVRFPHPQQLRGSLGEIPEGRNLDSHVAFFLAINPGHANGDELVCLTEISEANLTAAGERMVRPA